MSVNTDLLDTLSIPNQGSWHLATRQTSRDLQLKMKTDRQSESMNKIISYNGFCLGLNLITLLGSS